MSDAHIYLEIEGAVATIVLNRADKANALCHAMWCAIPELIRAAEADPNVRVLILRAAEAAPFSAGADLAEFKANARDVEKSLATQAAFRAAAAAIRNSRLPSIAQIEGACAGGGCGLAVACDFRYSTPNARFGVTPARLGLVYPLSEVKALVDLIGPSNAKLLLFTGRIITADAALAMGLVNAIHAVDAISEEVWSFAHEIAAQSTYSSRGHKRILELVLEGHAVDTDETLALFRDAFSGADYQEGVSAFIEKRQARF